MKKIFYIGTKIDLIPDGTRTHNLRLRKPTPCPFGHWDNVHLQWDSNPQSHP